MEQIKNIKGLRDDLLLVYRQLRTGAITDLHAKTISNVAGKIISSVKTEVFYNNHMEQKKVIDFMEGEEQLQEK